MVGAIIAAAISAVASGIGSAVVNKRKREAEEEYAKKQADMIGDIDKELNSDYLERADSRNAVRKVTESNKEAMRQLNTDAIRGGATDEAKVAMASQLNKRTAEVVGDLAAIGEQHKDSLRRDRRSLLMGQAAHEYQVNSDTSGIDSVIQGVSNAANAIGAGIDGKAGDPKAGDPKASAGNVIPELSPELAAGITAAARAVNAPNADPRIAALKPLYSNLVPEGVVDPEGKTIRDALGQNQFKYGTM